MGGPYLFSYNCMEITVDRPSAGNVLWLENPLSEWSIFRHWLNRDPVPDEDVSGLPSTFIHAHNLGA